MEKIVILAGPTAVGKSSLAIEWAQLDPRIEIINADSVQIYSDTRIGSAQPSSDELKRIPHHLVGVCSPSAPITSSDFIGRTEAILDQILARGRIPLVVGGSGFYIQALMYGTWDTGPPDPELRKTLEATPLQKLYEELEKQDPETAYQVGPADRYRLVRSVELIRQSGKTPTYFRTQHVKVLKRPYELWLIERDRQDLLERVALRAQKMLQEGLIEETQSLLKFHPEARVLRSVGYAQVVNYLQGKSPQGRKIRSGVEGLEDEIFLATRQLIKAQRTWFKTQKIDQKFVLEQDRNSARSAWEKVLSSFK